MNILFEIIFLQIIETSEKVLADRLAAKGKKVTREDIQILLAEHLKTIERIQQVKDAGKLEPSEPSTIKNNTPRVPLNNNSKKNFRPESASKVRKLNSGKKAKSELPPIGGKAKGDQSVESKFSQSLDSVPNSPGKVSDSEEIETIVESPESSPNTRSKNQQSFNESGIESDPDNCDAMQVIICLNLL